MNFFERDVLIDYLLGRLSPDQVEAVEQRALVDPDLAQTIEALRSEIDFVDDVRHSTKNAKHFLPSLFRGRGASFHRSEESTENPIDNIAGKHNTEPDSKTSQTFSRNRRRSKRFEYIPKRVEAPLRYDNSGFVFKHASCVNSGNKSNHRSEICGSLFSSFRDSLHLTFAFSDFELSAVVFARIPRYLLDVQIKGRYDFDTNVFCSEQPSYPTVILSIQADVENMSMSSSLSVESERALFSGWRLCKKNGAVFVPNFSQSNGDWDFTQVSVQTKPLQDVRIIGAVPNSVDVLPLEYSEVKENASIVGSRELVAAELCTKNLPVDYFVTEKFEDWSSETYAKFYDSEFDWDASTAIRQLSVAWDEITGVFLQEQDVTVIGSDTEFLEPTLIQGILANHGESFSESFESTEWSPFTYLNDIFSENRFINSICVTTLSASQNSEVEASDGYFFVPTSGFVALVERRIWDLTASVPSISIRALVEVGKYTIVGVSIVKMPNVDYIFQLKQEQSVVVNILSECVDNIALFDKVRSTVAVPKSREKTSVIPIQKEFIKGEVERSYSVELSEEDREIGPTLSAEEAFLAELLGRDPTPLELDEYYWEEVDDTQNVEKASLVSKSLYNLLMLITAPPVWIGRCTIGTLKVCFPYGLSSIEDRRSTNRRNESKSRVSDMMISTIAGVLIAVCFVFPGLKYVVREVFAIVVQSKVRKIGENVSLTPEETYLEETLVPIISEHILYPHYTPDESADEIILPEEDKVY